MAEASTLKDRIRQAQLLFMARTSRLLDEADDIRQQRDELLKLIEAAATKDKRRKEARHA